MRLCSDDHNKVKTPHMKMCSDVNVGMWGHRTILKNKTKLADRSGWVTRFLQKIIPLRGSILQAGTCQFRSLF